MNYINNILIEINKLIIFDEFGNDIIYNNKIGNIIANHIIASQLDKQYVIDAQKYLKECEQ